MKELLQQLIKENDIPIIDEKRNYWFVRTNSGEYFDSFYFGNFIAIEWDEIRDLEEIKEISSKDLKEKVAKLYPDDRTGYVASLIHKFVNKMKAGDIILIPNKDSKHIAFGQLLEDEPYIYLPTKEEKFQLDLEEDDRQLFLAKRRRVKWFDNKVVKKEDLDPYLFKIIYSHNTIVDANSYSSFIDRTLYNIYFKNNKLHTTFHVNKRENIQALNLVDFINNIMESVDIFSEVTEQNINKKDIAIKASINSPGPIEFIGYSAGVAICLTGVSMFLNGGKFSLDLKVLGSGSKIECETPGIIEKIEQYNSSKNQKLKKLEEKLIESKETLDIKNK